MMTQLRSTLNDTITRMVDEINALQFNIFEVVGAIPSSEQITGGSLTATPATANETAASLLLDQLKIVSLNTKATTSVANQLAAVLATETGTETSGNLLISGEEYVALVAMFVERLEANMVGTSITTLSHSISSVMTTLNEDQATSLREMNTRLAS